MNLEKQHIGNNIERLRHIKGLKQQTLACELGISQAFLSKIEKSAKINSLTLDKISHSLNVDPVIIENFNEEMIIRSLESYLMTSNDTPSQLILCNIYEQIINLEREKSMQLMNYINPAKNHINSSKE